MTDVRSSNTIVVLVDVPGFLDEVLARELGDDGGFEIMRLGDPRLATRNHRGAVVVMKATLASLNRSPARLPMHMRILGTVAVTEGDDSRGDAYLVKAAGTNVSHRELAQIIRSLAAGRDTALAMVRQEDQAFSRGEQ